MTSWPWLLWLFWLALVGLITPHQLYHAWRAGRGQRQALSRPTFGQSILLVAMAVVASSLATLVSFVNLDWNLVLAGFVSAWILLAGAMAKGPLSRLLMRLMIGQQWSDMAMQVSRRGKSIAPWFGSLFSVPSMPVLIGKVLLAIIILVVLNELTNADKTLIQPFKVLRLPERTQSGNPGPESSEIGQAISERIVHTLGLLQQELRHEVILASQPEAGDTVGRKQFDLLRFTNISLQERPGILAPEGRLVNQFR
jgi:hypothetical protein